MGMTMTQKIIAAHCGQERVSAGELVCAYTDLVLGNDITAPVAINEFEAMGAREVFSKDKIALVLDHFVPCKDIKSAQQCAQVRKFAKQHGVTHFYDAGQMGIEHALLPEQGLTVPGDLIIGADSHTCTYGALGAFSTGVGSTDMAVAMATGKAWFKVPSAIRFNISGALQKNVSGKDVILQIIGKIGVNGASYRSMEFGGDLSSLSVSDRLCMANMAIEAGAKNGIFETDDEALRFVAERTSRLPKAYFPDEDALYDAVYDIDLGGIKPTVAFPHLPENIKTEEEFGNIKVDQVVIGSCTNGRIEDLREAASVFAGRRVAEGVRAIIIPATQNIYLEALEEGLIKAFIEAGCAVSTPTCGPCLGGYMGILAEGERCVATTNRNFVGRMGHPSSEVYLASPATAAASAVAGRIISANSL